MVSITILNRARKFIVGLRLQRGKVTLPVSRGLLAALSNLLSSRRLESYYAVWPLNIRFYAGDNPVNGIYRDLE